MVLFLRSLGGDLSYEGNFGGNWKKKGGKIRGRHIMAKV
jgi:hypothetical protein